MSGGTARYTGEILFGVPINKTDDISSMTMTITMSIGFDIHVLVRGGYSHYYTNTTLIGYMQFPPHADQEPAYIPSLSRARRRDRTPWFVDCDVVLPGGG